MKSSQYRKSLFSLVAIAFCWTGSAAQTTDDDEQNQLLTDGPKVPDDAADQAFEAIVIDDIADQAFEDIVYDDAAEEAFEDFVFDEESRNYSLEEDDEIYADEVKPVEPTPQFELDIDELKRLFVLFRESLANKAYLEADTLAKRIVELSINLNGLDSQDTAKAITNLGIAQHHNQDYESAMLNFATSIGIIERIDNRLSAELINPLQGLAATQAATGRPDLAKKSYQRAVHVSHVNEGPHNRDQVETLEAMAALQISMGDIDDAVKIQQNIYALESRKIDPLSLDIIPALENQAKWQHRLQLYQNERATWRRIINVIEKHEGRESLALLSPLTSLGKSYLFINQQQYYYQQDVSSSSGEAYLRRANRIADINPNSDWMVLEGTLLSLGDYYILSGRPNRAAKTYQEIWTLLSEDNDPERMQLRWKHLEQVNALQKTFPPKYYNSPQQEAGRPPPENFKTGTMTFSFGVAANGRITNLVNLETEPKELGDFSKVVSRSMRRMIYRPRNKEGKLAATAGVIYTHDFFYRPSDLPSRQPARPAPVVEETVEPASADNDQE